MNKTILVKHMPDCCRECEFCYSTEGRCYLTGEDVRDTKLDDCPLVSFPPRIKDKEPPKEATAKEIYRKGLNDGWNALVDILEGKR